MTGLRVLAIDDEEPALEDLRHLLAEHDVVESVTCASDVSVALHALEGDRFDAVFLDIHLPDIDGLDLARVLRRFVEPPRVVFVTAFERHAVEAFEVDAVDYLLKPVGSERLGAALARVVASLGVPAPSASGLGASRSEVPASHPVPAGELVGTGLQAPGTEITGETRFDAVTFVVGEDGGSGAPGTQPVTIPVERAGRTRLVERGEISVVESEGDYVRLHIGDTSYLVRVPLGKLETEWGPAGFIRVHRSFLVNLRHLDELRTEANGGLVARVAGRIVPVSRRGQRTVREYLASAARLGGLAPVPRPTSRHGATELGR